MCTKLADQAARFPDLDLNKPDTTGLEPRDAALAHAIYDTVIRRWSTLRWLIEEAGGRALADLEPKMQAVLLCGTAQLVLLDRIPRHAAINESVEWAKRRMRPKAGAMVNAILRKVASAVGEDRPKRDEWTSQRDELPLADGGALVLVGPTLPDAELERTAIVTSVPRSLLRRWGRQTSPETAIKLALHTITPAPVVLRVGNTNTGPIEKMVGPHNSPMHRVFRGPRESLVRVLGQNPGIWVQDSASSATIDSLKPMSPKRIVDVCAGRGTKTRQLLEVFPRAQVIAAEINPERIRELEKQFGGMPDMRVMHVSELAEQVNGKADLVLLDVPCSNTGVLARRAEAKHRAGQAQTDRLIHTQRQIIESSIGLLSPGGLMVYSTCSLDRAENEEQVEWACEQFGLRLESESMRWPQGGPGCESKDYQDGAYSASMRLAGAGKG